MVFDEDCGCLNICYILVRWPVSLLVLEKVPSESS